MMNIGRKIFGAKNGLDCKSNTSTIAFDAYQARKTVRIKHEPIKIIIVILIALDTFHNITVAPNTTAPNTSVNNTFA